MNNKYFVTFFTKAGKAIPTTMEMPSINDIVGFVDTNDFIMVDQAGGATAVIPQNSIDYFTVQAVR